MKFFHKKHRIPEYSYDPAQQKPVVYSSICTGEKRAGFEWVQTGRFQEVKYIRSQKDMEDFLSDYGLKPEDIEIMY